MKKMDDDAAKKLFLEQAAAYYDELRATAKNAPYGKVFANAEALAVAQGRELLRQSLENVVQQQEQHFEQEEKKTARHALAAELDDIAESRRKKP